MVHVNQVFLGLINYGNEIINWTAEEMNAPHVIFLCVFSIKSVINYKKINEGQGIYVWIQMAI
jgi:hypothetical protein